MFQNQNPVGSGMEPTAQQNINYNGMQPSQQQPQQQQQTGANRNARKKPYVKITEQPAGKALRFRYECEGRSAGSIPGVNSTPENKTYPTIEIVGYKGRAVVVVSCVTKDMPYRPHPHNLVGKEGCKKGVCTLEINSETMRAVFSNLGIQCVKKKDIESALKAREEIRVDPFKTGFAHRFQPSSIDLNSVRLCFQVFMESDQKGRFTQPLPPVVSEPIYDKKAMSDLVICRLCKCSASVLGNTQIILLCEKVAKEDIAVRFFEEKNGQVVWEAYGEFQHTDVHKQTAITFRTPRYHTMDITEPAKVFIQLKRPSDGVTSEPLQFEYVPLDSGRHTFWNLRRNLKRKPDLDIFQQILSIDNDQEHHLSCDQITNVANKIPSDAAAVTEIIDLNTPTNESEHKNIFSNSMEMPMATVTTTATSTITTDIMAENQELLAGMSSEQEIDAIIEEKVREMEEHGLLQTEAQIVDEINQQFEAQGGHATMKTEQLTANDKINEWIKTNEVPQNQVANTETITTTMTDQVVGNAGTMSQMNEEDKTLSDLLEQVAELDEIYADHVLQRDTYNATLMNELSGIDACVPDSTTMPDGGQTAMEIDETFDDAATYSSLQIAFKNPITIPMEDVMPPTPPGSHLAPEDAHNYDPVEVRSGTPVLRSLPISQSQELHQPLQQHQQQLDQVPPRPAPPKFSSPHMHVTAAEEEKLPPLPPKRLRKQDSNAENRSIEANSGDNTSTLDRKSRQQTPIIIMRTPDQSPPTKRLPPKPTGNSNTLPKQKKSGFFSKLFSRRKSKSELSQAASEQNSIAGSKTGSKINTPNGSREPSIGHFQMSDPNRSSIKSSKSLQVNSLPTSPEKVDSSHQDPVHLKRKRQKTGSDPMHLLLQQHQNEQNKEGRAENLTCWNSPNIPPIKTEPRDTSPQPFGTYRAPPQPDMTPSPQPLSPSTPYHQPNTTGGYNNAAVGPIGGGNVQMLSPNHPHHHPHAHPHHHHQHQQQQQQQSLQQQSHQHQQHQYNLLNLGGNPVASVTAAAGISMQNYNAFVQQQQQQHQQQHYQNNPFSGMQWDGKFANSNNNPNTTGSNNNNNTNNNNNANQMSNLNTTNPFTMHNLLASSNAVPGGSGGGMTGLGATQPQWNLAPNHLHHHPHHQQLQQQQQQQQYQQQNNEHIGGTTTNSPNPIANNTNNNNNINNNNNNNNNINNEQAPTLSTLLSFDSEQLVRINSEEQQMLRLNSEDLQISNLSIST